MNSRARRFRLLVFDWDGTLMDSTAAIAGALKASCRDLGIEEPSDERASYIIGLGLIEALRYAVPDLPEQQYGRLLERYRVHWLEFERSTDLFPEVPETLRALRDAGFLLAVATGKSRRGLDRALTSTGTSDLFHATRCADESRSKPDPLMLHDLMQGLAVSPRDTLMIGDTTHDLKMAAAAQVPGFAVTYGAHPRAQLAALAPLGCADDVAELRYWLEQWA